MPMFPDPSSNSAPMMLGESYYQVMAEGVFPPNTEITWYFWGFQTASPFPDVFQIPMTFKSFLAIPVWPNSTVGIASVEVDVPAEAPQTLRYTVKVRNTGQGDAAYRLLCVSHALTIDGALIDWAD